MEAPSGGVLVDAEVSRQDVTAAAPALRESRRAISAGRLCATLFMAIGPMLDAAPIIDAWPVSRLTAAMAVALLAARDARPVAISVVTDFQPLDSPLNILVTGLTPPGLVALAISVVERAASRRRARRIAQPGRSARLRSA